MQHNNNNDHPSIVQNIGGDQNQVVGGNIIHGDAHIHLHGDTHQHQPPGGQEATRLENVESVILVCLCLASLSLSTLINFSSEQNIDKTEKWPMARITRARRCKLFDRSAEVWYKCYSGHSRWNKICSGKNFKGNWSIIEENRERTQTMEEKVVKIMDGGWRL